jgi:hypothetical protein
MQLKICGVLEADELLALPNHGVDAAISILDPGCRAFIRPSGLSTVKHTLELDFDDVEVVHEDYQYPTMQDARDV